MKVGACNWRLSEGECVLHFVHVHITSNIALVPQMSASMTFLPAA